MNTYKITIVTNEIVCGKSSAIELTGVKSYQFSSDNMWLLIDYVSGVHKKIRASKIDEIGVETITLQNMKVGDVFDLRAADDLTAEQKLLKEAGLSFSPGETQKARIDQLEQDLESLTAGLLNAQNELNARDELPVVTIIRSLSNDEMTVFLDGIEKYAVLPEDEDVVAWVLGHLADEGVISLINNI